MAKQLTNFILVISVPLLLLSCGRWSDNIKLSTSSAVFKSNGDSIIITTKGEGWWLTGIEVNKVRNYNFAGAYVIADSYVVKQDCYIFERRNKNTIFIKLDPNLSGSKRTVIFYLEAGDYFDHITITQNSE